ncbi:MAG: cyclase family protein [Alicyclobacillaceae bacterium]|nr:cyclase family protein [Alicyclobacillaceae bacterium]
MTGTSALQQLRDLFAHAKVVDLSPLLENGIPRWPTHPPLVIDPTVTHEHDGYYCQSVYMAEHTGSHVDAPHHIHADMPEATVEHIPPAALIGPATVVDLSDRQWQPGERATLADVKRWSERTGVQVEPGDIVLFHFGWLRRYWTTSGAWKRYAYNQPGFAEDLADFVIETGVRAVGTDTVAVGTPVVDGNQERCYFHERVLRRHIYLMECLDNLDQLPPKCFFIAAPLKIKRGSGSPIRAIALIPEAR